MASYNEQELKEMHTEVIAVDLLLDAVSWSHLCCKQASVVQGLHASDTKSYANFVWYLGASRKHLAALHSPYLMSSAVLSSYLHN